jgi:uncharacterized secreted protein with C-terminal beta-propeller domain
MDKNDSHKAEMDEMRDAAEPGTDAEPAASSTALAPDAPTGVDPGTGAAFEAAGVDADALEATGYFTDMERTLPPASRYMTGNAQPERRSRVSRRLRTLLPLAACFVLVIAVVATQGTALHRILTGGAGSDSLVRQEQTGAGAGVSGSSLYDQTDAGAGTAQASSLARAGKEYKGVFKIFEEYAPAPPAAPPSDSYSGDSADGMPMDDLPGGLEADASDGGTDFSDTNTQVSGVQEADIVKTDGRYIYTANDESVTILAAGDGQPVKLAEIPQVTGSGQCWFEMYVTEDRLILIRTGYSNFLKDATEVQKEAYALDGSIVYPGSMVMQDTAVDIYDITDRARPQKIQSLSQSGSYNDSRMIGDKLYLISTYDRFDYEAMDKDEARSFVPLFAEGNKQSEAEPEDIQVLPEGTQLSYIVVSGIDTEQGRMVDNESIFGGFPIIYCSQDSLYLLNSRWEDRDDNTDPIETKRQGEKKIWLYDDSGMQTTQISRIALEDGRLSMAATGTIDGGVDSQFFVDESKGVLRVVATESRYYDVYKRSAEIVVISADAIKAVYCYKDDPEDRYTFYRDPKDAEESDEYDWVYFDGDVPYEYYDQNEETTTSLYTLDKDLKPLAKIGNLAPGETVYSARFMGDIGYFVTFRQVDPLFSVDLSDPKEPRVIGELKIPGFSEYLQPYGQGLLFGFGRDADEDSGEEGTLKLSMFDNSVPSDVREKDKLILTDLWDSEASYNHKAILADASKGIVAFPADGQYIICGYTPEEGFRRIVDVRLEGVNKNFGYWYSSLRGLFIEDIFYVVSANSVHCYDMQDGFRKIGSLTLSRTAGPASDYGTAIYALPEEFSEKDPYIDGGGVWNVEEW